MNTFYASYIIKSKTFKFGNVDFLCWHFGMVTLRYNYKKNIILNLDCG